jgi:putative flavoprotein involved in K+ transport
MIRSVQRATVPDLQEFGLPRPEVGVYTRILRDNAIPILDVGLIDAVRRRQVGIVPAVVDLDRSQVVLADGSRDEPDVVIVAAGYHSGLEPLVGHLGVLGPDGRPLVRGRHTHANAPGMWFTGYTNPISGMFRELAIDARRIARAIAESSPEALGSVRQEHVA